MDGSQSNQIIPVDLDSSETTTLSSRTSLPSLSNTTSSIESSASSLQNVLFERSSGSQEMDYSAEPLIIRKACRFDCYCSCHPKSEVEEGSMPSLSRSFSRLGLSASPCDDPSCKFAMAVEKAADPASNFFRKALSHVMSGHSVKIRHHLNTFRMVPENADVMRYSKQGSLDSLKTAFQSGEATLWDTEPDGWSLLHVSSG